MCQAEIARKIKVSRSYVNQVIKRLESLGLIQRVDTHKTKPGMRAYTLFYELSPELKARIKGDKVAAPFTEMRTHHIQMKFKVISQSDKPTKDKRTSFNKSWFMRGQSERFKYWYIGRAGLPSVSLTAHPKTIVITMDKGQKIVAASAKEAEQMAVLACYQAKDKFVQEQAKFGITFETEHTGVRIGKTHVGLAFHEGGPLDSPINIPGMWVDKSVEKELGPGFKEVESYIDHELATPLEKGVMAVAALPAAMKEFTDKLNPMSESILQVQAMMQGSITNQQMLENVTKLISSVLIEMQSIRAENAELKARLG